MRTDNPLLVLNEPITDDEFVKYMTKLPPMPNKFNPKLPQRPINNQMKDVHKKFVPKQFKPPGSSDGVVDYKDVISPLKKHAENAPWQTAQQMNQWATFTPLLNKAKPNKNNYNFNPHGVGNDPQLYTPFDPFLVKWK